MVTPSAVVSCLHDPVLHVAVSLGLTLLLGGSALHKLRDSTRFQVVLSSYRLVPSKLLRFVASVLPLIELIAALGALMSLWIPLWASLATGLLMLYAGVLAVSVRRGTAMEDCGCHFGNQRQALSVELVWRNLLLALLAANLLYPMIERTLGWFDLAITFFALLTGAIFYLLANLLVATRTSQRDLLR
ncbi:MauE/DoxX family redox-associated membrane protein [Pseudomonas sp. T8]|uniref:MauE/DoxX family redox-associated membrane protein n=1 Tax=Pseudomonas sp. T8 TaxID=645292 RepID=UPI0021472800|nr:MauE/DoxX family redox-associated membrane protein [Pseudomonas sp. T8]UUT22911.1 hypothetical protein NRG23_02795 [Pseudomonas sp. T8]